MSDPYEVYRNALIADKAGDWDKSHELIQDIETNEAAWIHAYLHRKEGDQWNAGYWYRRAGKPVFDGSLDEEWDLLWDYLKDSSGDL